MARSSHQHREDGAPAKRRREGSDGEEAAAAAAAAPALGRHVLDERQRQRPDRNKPRENHRAGQQQPPQQPVGRTASAAAPQQQGQQPQQHQRQQQPQHQQQQQQQQQRGQQQQQPQQPPSKKHKSKAARLNKHRPAPLLPPLPRGGGGSAAAALGSNWAQLRAKMAAEAPAEGGQPRPRHPHPGQQPRRPTLAQLNQQQQQQQQQQAAKAGGVGGGKKALRPIAALAPAGAAAPPLAEPIATGAAAAAALGATVARGAAARAAATAATASSTAAGGGLLVTAAATAAATTTTTTTPADAADADGDATNAPPTPVLAIDCEMVGVGPDGKRSALARVCLVNARGQVVLDTHVAPRERVTDHRTWVSGVRPADLAGAPQLEEVQRRVAALVAGRVLVGHSIGGDLRALLLSHPRRLTRDTARYPPLMRRAARAPEGMGAGAAAADIARGKRRPKALRVLAAQELGLDIQSGEHTPVDDARAALYLYLHHAREWERALRTEGGVSRLPVGVVGGAAGVAAAVAEARRARQAKQGKGGRKGEGGGGGRAAARPTNTLDVRELAKQDRFADL